MLFWNIFVFFLLPLLVLFLTRKLSVRGMILWTAGVQVVALLLRMVVYPVRLSLSWGMSLLNLCLTVIFRPGIVGAESS